ncbi:helix-turn-helix domain-containing protein [Burkholderia sp. PU8-34]
MSLVKPNDSNFSMSGLCMSGLAKTFAEQVRLLREAEKLSQEGLGDRIGLDRTVISRIERTRPNLTIARAALIAAALGVSVSRLLRSEDANATTSAPSKQETAEELLQRIPKNLKAHREQSNMTQRQLAERLGADRNWVSAVESGRENLTLNTIEKFANALNKTPIELLANPAESTDKS